MPDAITLEADFTGLNYFLRCANNASLAVNAIVQGQSYHSDRLLTELSDLMRDFWKNGGPADADRA
jgi:hypothetical protein